MPTFPISAKDRIRLMIKVTVAFIQKPNIHSWRPLLQQTKYLCYGQSAELDPDFGWVEARVLRCVLLRCCNLFIPFIVNLRVG